MPELLTPDLCVIGAGSGGLSVAAAAAALGAPTVLIEKAKMGGDCLNTGCVPSKALIAAARRAENARTAAAFGVRTGRVGVEFHEVNDHVHAAIAAIAPNDSKTRFEGLGVRVIEGSAAFRDSRTVAVDDRFEIRARRFVVATGSQPAIPAIEGLDRTPYLTNESVFESRALPRQLVVIGAGPVGLELAQAFRRLGSDVIVLESGVPLNRDDPESARIVIDRLRAEGIDIRTGVTVERVRRVRNRIEATLAGGEVVDGSDLLIATGRKPALDGLGLEAARIRTGPEGIVVDRRMRTSNRNVFAIGDAVGAMPFTHVANYHAGLVIRNALFRQPAKADYDAIPRVTFTDPELAHVGLTEAEARRRHRKIRVLRWPYHENDRAVAERETAGHIKVVTDRKGRILGATIVGATAGELIAAWTLAISQRMNVRVFAEIVMPYPTLSEIGKRAAVTAFAPRLTSPWVRRILGFLRRFG